MSKKETELQFTWEVLCPEAIGFLSANAAYSDTLASVSDAINSDVYEEVPKNPTDPKYIDEIYFQTKWYTFIQQVVGPLVDDYVPRIPGDNCEWGRASLKEYNTSQLFFFSMCVYNDNIPKNKTGTIKKEFFKYHVLKSEVMISEQEYQIQEKEDFIDGLEAKIYRIRTKKGRYG